MLGPLEPNNALSNAELLGDRQLENPEDFAFDGQGRLYTGCEDGWIYRLTRNPGFGVHVSWNEAAIHAHGSNVTHVDVFIEQFAQTTGRPLGLHFDSGGNLICCVHGRGLVTIDAEGNVKDLATVADGKPIMFANDLDIAGDGRIYFTDSSDKFHIGVKGLSPPYGAYDMLEAKPHGRLLMHDPATGNTDVLLDKLYFPNGVHVPADGQSVMYAETFQYRIRRLWLGGVKRGIKEDFAKNLPGFPDGFHEAEDGTFYVALGVPRNAAADFVHLNPPLKNLIAALPQKLWHEPERYGLVVRIDATGSIIGSLHDPTGHVYLISNAVPHGDDLWLGSVASDNVARVALDDVE